MSEKNTFFVTTPIYYTNGIPHIGHSYSSLIADSIARYQKISGKRVKFSTGVDENSQKIVQSAEKEGKDIMVYLDEMAEKHKAVWDGLGIEYTDFIRTTETRHHELVQKVLQISYDKGDIYQGEYAGKYCVGCEAFKKDEDLIPHPDPLLQGEGDTMILICPDHLKEPDVIKEKNYFFKLSKYQKDLEAYYEAHPDFVIPADRFNEVKAFVKRGLEDFSISRETNKFGIALPFDPSQVTYVWYDALFNYVTVCEKPYLSPTLSGDEREQAKKASQDFWPADLHVVGKDIIRFHAIYWPAMLLSAGYELPKNILTTGFFTVDGQKISKSLGNAIDPVEFTEKYSKDMLTLYLLSTFNIGQDGDFDQKQAVLTYNAKLANNLGNLVNRVVVLSLKAGGILSGDINKHKFYSNSISPVVDICYKSLNSYDLKSCIESAFHLTDSFNKTFEIEKPWELVGKDNETLIWILYTVAEGLRQVGLALYPFFPEKMSEMFVKLGLGSYREQLEAGKLGDLLQRQEIFVILEKGEALFQRIEV